MRKSKHGQLSGESRPINLHEPDHWAMHSAFGCPVTSQVATWHPVWKSRWYVVVSLHFVWTKFYIHPCALDSSCFQHWTSSMGPNSSYYLSRFSPNTKKARKKNSQNLLFSFSVSFRKFPYVSWGLRCLAMLRASFDGLGAASLGLGVTQLDVASTGLLAEPDEDMNYL